MILTFTASDLPESKKLKGFSVIHQEDLTLAKSLLAGDEKQFHAFFDHYFPRLYRFARSRMGDEDALQDVVQTTLINAVRSMKSYRGEAAMFTWLCKICRNEINMYLRKNARYSAEVAADDESIRPILEMLESDESDAPDTQYTRKETRDLINEVLDFLPANYGEILEMKYVLGESVSDIAEKLQLTELAAQSMLARARTAFRKALTQLSPEISRLSGGTV